MTSLTGRMPYAILSAVLGGIFLIWAFLDDPVMGGGLGFGGMQWLLLATGVTGLAVGLFLKSFARVYLFVLAWGGVFAIISELTLSFTVGPRFSTPYKYDSELIFALKPNATHEYRHIPANGGHSVFYHINSLGFRGPEFELNDPRRKVLVYGDSFIHAEFSELQDTFTEQLRADLEQRYRVQFNVINAGVAGYGPDQILLKMSRDLEILKPDLLIVSLFSPNDFGDLIRNRLFRLSASGELVPNTFVISEEVQRSIRLNKWELVTIRVLRASLKSGFSLVPKEPAFDKAKYITDLRAQHIAEWEAYNSGDNTVGAFGVDPYSADLALQPSLPSSQFKVRLMTAVVNEMARVAREKAIPLLIMIVPHPMDLLDGDHESGYVDRAAFPGYSPTRLTDEPEAIATKARVPYVNLFSRFRVQDVKSLYLKGGDDHWNAAGQKLAADVVAEFVQSNGLLK